MPGKLLSLLRLSNRSHALFRLHPKNLYPVPTHLLRRFRPDELANNRLHEGLFFVRSFSSRKNLMEEKYNLSDQVSAIDSKSQRQSPAILGVERVKCTDFRDGGSGWHGDGVRSSIIGKRRETSIGRGSQFSRKKNGGLERFGRNTGQWMGNGDRGIDNPSEMKSGTPQWRGNVDYSGLENSHFNSNVDNVVREKPSGGRPRNSGEWKPLLGNSRGNVMGSPLEKKCFVFDSHSEDDQDDDSELESFRKVPRKSKKRHNFSRKTEHLSDFGNDVDDDVDDDVDVSNDSDLESVLRELGGVGSISHSNAVSRNSRAGSNIRSNAFARNSRVDLNVSWGLNSGFDGNIEDDEGDKDGDVEPVKRELGGGRKIRGAKSFSRNSREGRKSYSFCNSGIGSVLEDEDDEDDKVVSDLEPVRRNSVRKELGGGGNIGGLKAFSRNSRGGTKASLAHNDGFGNDFEGDYEDDEDDCDFEPVRRESIRRELGGGRNFGESKAFFRNSRGDAKASLSHKGHFCSGFEDEDDKDNKNDCNLEPIGRETRGGQNPGWSKAFSINSRGGMKTSAVNDYFGSDYDDGDYGEDKHYSELRRESQGGWITDDSKVFSRHSRGHARDSSTVNGLFDDDNEDDSLRKETVRDRKKVNFRGANYCDDDDYRNLESGKRINNTEMIWRSGESFILGGSYYPKGWFDPDSEDDSEKEAELVDKKVKKKEVHDKMENLNISKISSSTPNISSSESSDSYLGKSRFDQYELSPSTLKAIKDLGFQSMTVVQEATLGIILNGLDVVAKARTGTGKTLAFLLPCIEAASKSPLFDGNLKYPPIIALIICPTRELAYQAAKEAKMLLKYNSGIRVHVFIGGISINAEKKIMESKPIHILVATPGRLKDHIDNSAGFVTRLSGLKVLVLDEADQLLDLGFRHHIENILSFVPKERQTLLFSATIPPGVLRISRVALKKNYRYIDTVPAGTEETHTKVKQMHMVAPLDQQFSIIYSLLKDHIADDADYKVLVFCSTAMVTSLVAQLLQALGLNVTEIHSRKSQTYRMKVSNDFRNSKGSILVTSDVSARGVDYPDVTLVVQVGMPVSREQYIHRLGRTGRKDTTGEGILLLAPWEESFIYTIKDLPLRKAELPMIYPNMTEKVMDALSRLPIKTKESAYQAWLGYYSGLKVAGLDKNGVVTQAKKFSRSMGLPCAPAIDFNVIKKMGLRNVRGLISK